MKDATVARVFFALWPDVSVRRELYSLVKEYRLQCDARGMRADGLHMTLLFLGEVERALLPQLVQSASKVSVPPFGIELNGVSFWKHNRIAYATQLGETRKLEQLAAALRQQLITDGFLFKNDGFVPHVTLLRRVRNILEPQKITPIMWWVDSFVLVESVTTGQGSHYQILQKWPLSPYAAASEID